MSSQQQRQPSFASTSAVGTATGSAEASATEPVDSDRIRDAIDRAAYRDFSRTTTLELATEVTYAKNRKPTFPRKLHEILSCGIHEDVIAWLPHGRAFSVCNVERLEEEVLPEYFRHRSRASFLRQVNNWNFKRIRDGSDENAYYHEYFLRGLPHVCLLMHPNKPNQPKDKMAKLFDVAPDFYRLSEERPLPLTDGEPVPLPTTAPISNATTNKSSLTAANPPQLQSTGLASSTTAQSNMFETSVPYVRMLPFAAFPGVMTAPFNFSPPNQLAPFVLPLFPIASPIAQVEQDPNNNSVQSQTSPQLHQLLNPTDIQNQPPQAHSQVMQQPFDLNLYLASQVGQLGPSVQPPSVVPIVATTTFIQPSGITNNRMSTLANIPMNPTMVALMENMQKAMNDATPLGDSASVDKDVPKSESSDTSAIQGLKEDDSLSFGC
eukprot:g9805.t1 g9805   contig4:618726-620300(+)